MGKLIVLEGTDGSGKATQTARLLERLRKEGISCRTVEFPRYREESSALIRQYLRGDFGASPSDVNAYAASAFYAVDRYASYKQDWGPFYQAGGLVIADRYTTSNAVHQGGKLDPEARKAYFDWLFDFEFRLMELPAPDLVLYLDVPVEQTRRNMEKRRQETDASGDIHERDQEYLRQCRASAIHAAEQFGWKTVPCVSGGVMRTVEEIHRDIFFAVKEIL